VTRATDPVSTTRCTPPPTAAEAQRASGAGAFGSTDVYTRQEGTMEYVHCTRCGAFLEDGGWTPISSWVSGTGEVAEERPNTSRSTSSYMTGAPEVPPTSYPTFADGRQA
jgi:hypothetical protein